MDKHCRLASSPNVKLMVRVPHQALRGDGPHPNNMHPTRKIVCFAPVLCRTEWMKMLQWSCLGGSCNRLECVHGPVKAELNHRVLYIVLCSTAPLDADDVISPALLLTVLLLPSGKGRLNRTKSKNAAGHCRTSNKGKELERENIVYSRQESALFEAPTLCAQQSGPFRLEDFINVGKSKWMSPWCRPWTSICRYFFCETLQYFEKSFKKQNQAKRTCEFYY